MDELRYNAIKKHTISQTILFHLCPGIIQLFVLILLIPPALHLGFPGSFADHLETFIALVPIQIGTLLFIAKKTTETCDILKLIPFQNKSKLPEYFIFLAVMIVWAFGIDAVLSPLEDGLRDGLFSFVPDALAGRDVDLSMFAKNKLIISACLGILANGIVAPVTEELYFRGYLLPRIDASPFAAVLLNAILFSLYHFFSPWYFFSRLLMMIPLYYWVMKRKNIRFSLAAHIIANTYSSISVLLDLL